ncbi:MAG: apolipoprotein N-acyltransferase [Planctomycetota bacterium]
MQASDAAPTEPSKPHGWRITLILGVVHAACFLFAFPPFHLVPLIPASILALTVCALRAASLRRAIMIVGVCQVSMWLIMQRWVGEISAAGWPPFAIYMSLYAIAYTVLVRRIALGRRTQRLPMTVIAPIVWVGLEFLRGRIVFGGYAWYFAAHPMIEWTPLVQTASWLGTYFVSFLVVVAAAMLLDAWHRRRRAAGAACVLVVGAIVYGLIVQPPADTPTVRVLAVQTNVPQSNKIAWSLQQKQADVTSFLEMTRDGAAASTEPIDLIVWPETMLPVHGLEREALETLAAYGQNMEIAFAVAAVELQRELDIPMLLGVPSYEGLRVNAESYFEWDAHYNSAYLVAGDYPFARYDKVVRTPFGEYMPYVSVWPWLEEKMLAVAASGMSFDLDAADAQTRLPALSVAGESITGQIATPICFEDTVSTLCRAMAMENGEKAIDLFVNLSNDGWFGSSDGGRAAHAQVARFRCVEHRIPMVRSANTGHSMGIDSLGNIIARVGPGRYGEGQLAGTVLAELPLDPRTTLYSRIGDVWGWVCGVGMIGLAVFAGPRRHGQRSEDSHESHEPQKA